MQIDIKDEFSARLVERILSARGADQESPDQIHASDVGKCMRQIYYRLTGTPPDPGKVVDDDRINLIYKYGDALEHVLTVQMQFAGIWRGRAKIYTSVFDLVGTTDPVVDFEGKHVILEIKGTHRKHFAVMANKLAQGDCENYYSQIQTYLHLYPRAEFAVLIIGNRDMRPVDELPPLIWGKIERSESWKKENWQRLQNLRVALDTRTPPEREFTYNDWHCRYCPWRDTDWGSALKEVEGIEAKQVGEF